MLILYCSQTATQTLVRSRSFSLSFVSVPQSLSAQPLTPKTTKKMRWRRRRRLYRPQTKKTRWWRRSTDHKLFIRSVIILISVFNFFFSFQKKVVVFLFAFDHSCSFSSCGPNEEEHSAASESWIHTSSMTYTLPKLRISTWWMRNDRRNFRTNFNGYEAVFFCFEMTMMKA